MADVMAFGITSLLIAYRGVTPPRSTPSVRFTESDLRDFSMLIPFILGLVSFIFPPLAVEYEKDLTQHPLVAGDPGFTWCYQRNMGSPCVHTSTPPDQCVSFTGNTPDNDKARSVTTDANSHCTLYQHVQCQGKSLEIAPATTIDNLGAYGFDKEMSSYRCQWAANVPTEVTCNIMVKDINGTEFGYISPVFTSGFYETFQSVQHGALSVAFSYLPDARTRLNLRTLNGLGAAPDSTFPFLGGIVLGNERLRLDRPSYTSIPLGGTCATPPSGEPRVFTRHNSHSANVDGKENYVESPIWRYDPGTNALTAQWINPDGSEPETTIMLSQTPTLSGLELTGDIDGVRWYARWEPGPSSFAEVTFTCVPLA